MNTLLKNLNLRLLLILVIHITTPTQSGKYSILIELRYALNYELMLIISNTTLEQNKFHEVHLPNTISGGYRNEIYFFLSLSGEL